MTLQTWRRLEQEWSVRAACMAIAIAALAACDAGHAQLGERAVKFILPVAAASGVDATAQNAFHVSAG